MSAQTVVTIDQAAVSALSSSKGEPAWLSELRKEASVLAGQLELPVLEKTKIERWNINSYGNYKSSEAVASFDALPEAVRALVSAESQNLIVQHNSSVVFRKLSPELEKQGVVFTDLETAMKTHGDLIKQYFMQAVKVDENRQTAIHAALWNGGAFLYVPKNVVIEEPLQAMFFADDASATIAPHVLVIAEANSSVTYVDNFASSVSGELTLNGIVEVFVKPGAQVRFASVHHMEKGVTDLQYRRAIVENDSRVEWIIGEMNAGNTMSDTKTDLRGNGSTSDAKVINVGSEDQKLNITTRAVHWGKNSESDMITRAVMRDEATAIINGITKIEKAATGANGQQTERVLMLSPKARGDANPILLIDEDDVKAGHAASVGQVNPEQVFYMMSRGISKQEAERLIIYGFLAPVVSEIPVEQLQQQLQSVIERKLGR
ncbi:Fe-S cluster assembly protein SufD [Paenibacillus turpanensis]|uniref:Fe-S cluster assembly protein SufD n=1 Tax=Paenibacillus turpanensis TaxID=2689078 RepID=UPI00140B6DC1|nr:Fe-S cluster assembly protein SufD [Paenibacillus turpanensis]